MVFFCYKDFKLPRITRVGAVGGRGWRFGGQKARFAPQLIWHVGPNFRQKNSSAMESCILQA
eukprot:1154562-Pelagomonas_calceolata.AAC.6